MSLFISSLNSGSNANCYYIGNENEAILVDAGLSCRETAKRMKRLGLSMGLVKAIFVSHEHCDHINGIPLLVKNYNLPVYITPATLKHCHLSLPPEQVRYFRSNEVIAIGDLYITAFRKLHDASEPHSFVVTCKGATVGVFTDIGHPCENLTYHFKQCHAAFLEANYDEELLHNGSYPYHLKKRISGGKGHLSNKQALEFFVSQRSGYLSHLILSHLSQNNNCPQRVSDLFNLHRENTEIIVASRFRETPVLHVTAMKDVTTKRPTVTSVQRSYQISLF